MTTDFGLDDVYVGVMKGVILSIAPAACLLDLTHAIPPQDVLSGCLALETSRPYCPLGTVHLAVVDPGVGTERRGLVVETQRDLWVAPDNGLLSFLPPRDILRAFVIEVPTFWWHPVSRTFHGRDVFAPVAAHLALGRPPETFGPAAGDIVRTPLPAAEVTPAGASGEVLAFDRFGNAITSLQERDLPCTAPDIVLAGWAVRWGQTYADTAPGEPVALLGSSSRVEISVREGSAREVLGLRRGDEVLALRK